jgi:hypothetical protein
MSGVVRGSEDVEVLQTTTPYAENVPPLLVSEPIVVEEAVFVTLADVRHADWHPPPRRQLVIIVDCELEIETTDGEKRTFDPGMVAVVEDLGGRGHVTTVSSPGPATFMAIPLAG